ncbi:aminodeoxychorismate lyase [Salinicola rhizosphaerae]|uniref:Aminodeoxychorismate lyase n=1 Tax=Salinicola rhizosphaerae TaxID=1443141 RepID=A0ABQ3DRI5_9GAMM|nr:aminodeoxychorismate lyase [Salinicola rhizosphaerae]GHB08159.1 aminodeoxychorismate lyase [Salinicola rhizosphaerae]
MLDEPLPLDDRGFAYGDGLFETVLVRDGQALLWRAHLERLERGAERLGFELPDPASLQALPARCGPGLTVLKLVVTRGSGGRGYRPPGVAEPRWRWSVAPFAPQPERWRHGVVVRLCQLRLSWQPRLAGIKHLARLENVLARQEWQDENIAEGILCDGDGNLVEATAMNLIWRRAGVLETPRLDRCGVAGTLLEALGERLPIHRVQASDLALREADAAWVLNSVQGVWPLRRLVSAEGTRLKDWSLERQDSLQSAAHSLLGYPGSEDLRDLVAK